MTRYLVVADDFTGANDSGAQMRKAGIDVQIVLFPEETGQAASVVLDTESRNVPAEDAAGMVREKAGAVLKGRTYDLIYKKIDSTLRGNVVEEIRALTEISGRKKIVFCPAFPQIGRTTVEGIHALHGQRLMETEFAGDLEKPICTDDVRELIAPLGEVIHHDLKTIRSGEISLDAGVVHTFDAEKASDLAAIAALAPAHPEVLWVGSAGLANALFAQLHPKQPVLSVIGSISAVSLAQMEFAEEAGIAVFRVNPEKMLRGIPDPGCVEAVTACLLEGRDAILTATRERIDYEDTVRLAKDAIGISKHEASKRVQVYLARITAEVLQKAKVSGLFLTGGDTAISVIRALDASGAAIVREVLTAIVLSTLAGGRYDGLPVIAKAGAFGQKEDLVYCIGKLKEGIQ